MNELPEPSPWFTEHFGEHSEEVALAFAKAGRAAHERSLDAKAGSQLTSNEAYGSFWKILPEEVEKHLKFLPGHEVVQPTGSRYDLVVFDGTLIFPAKYGRGSSDADNIKLRNSDFRHRVFSLKDGTESETQDQLIFGLNIDDEPITTVKNGSFGSATRVLLIAYEVSARGGLQHIYVGKASLESTGLVNWHYREELPLRLLDGEGVALAGLNQPSTARFDDAPLPGDSLTLRAPLALPGDDECVVDLTEIKNESVMDEHL